MKIKLSVVALAVFAFLMVAVATAGLAAKTLRVGMNAEFSPFEFSDEKGKLQGFDVELANAIGKAMGYKVTFHNVAWDGIIPACSTATTTASCPQ